jgi:hypothetical protein
MQRELYRWMEEQGDKGVLMDTQNPEQTIQNIRQPVRKVGIK